jgi:hypothetical protein
MNFKTEPKRCSACRIEKRIRRQQLGFPVADYYPRQNETV